MQQTSSNYKKEIKQPSRSFECRVTIGKNVYTNDNIVDIIIDYPQANNGYSIGNTVSQSLDLVLLNTGEQIYSTNQIKVEIGLKIGDTIEYVPMGYYNVDEVSKNDYTIKFTAFDNMIKFETPYFSSLGDTPTLKQVVDELVYITGVKFSGSIPSYTVKKLEGYTCREILSYVASLCGGDALITREGNFTIIIPKNSGYTVPPDNHFGLTTEETLYKVGKLTCVVDGETELSKGSIGTDAMELAFENPWMTDNILNSLYNQLKSFSYIGYAVKWQGDLALEPGDIITITDRKGLEYQVPILSQKFTYTGGLTCELGAKGESKNKNSFSASGSNSNKVNRLVTEQAIIKEALITKANIQDLEAVSIRTQRLEATTAKIETAIIDVAYVSDLNVIRASISELKAMDATISQAVINKADISELNAAVANIDILNADLATIKHLVAGNISSENIQTGGITSDKLTIATGFIKDAMIDSLNANKITAGQINTALVQVTSSSGNLIINDNTIQIHDANRVRVQIGKDASNDYSMSVWDSSGQLMFDARGLKADAIKDSIIRNDMISTSANIDGSKLNINSVVSEINEGSTTLKASKVQFDGIAQTLEVAFSVLKTQADGIKAQTESNTTAINVAQGKINTLIQDTTITKDGETTKLKDEYSKLEQTVSGINTAVGKQQTVIDDHTGKIISTSSELSTLKQSVDEIGAGISSAQTTLESHTTLISQKANSSDVYVKSEVYTKNQTESAINIAKDSINLGVSQTYETKSNVDTKVTDVKTEVTKYADNKVDSAKTELNNAIIAKADKTEVYTKSETYTKAQTDSAINVAKEAINLGVSQTYETKSSVTTKVSQAVVEARGVLDTRNDNQPPQWYFANYPKQTVTELKFAYILGIGNSEHRSYGTLTTVVPWAESSGGYPVQTFRSQAFPTYERKGTSNTDWSEWTQVEDTAGSQAKVDSAKTELNSKIDIKANKTDTYTKSETYTRVETDSKIKIAKEEINLNVSNIYETRENVETKITSAKTYADTKKAEAINAASSDATSKVNSAKTELNLAIGKKANSDDVYTKIETYTRSETDSKIKIAKDEINLGVSSKVTEGLSKIVIGGSNYLINSAPLQPTWSSWTGIATLTDTMQIMDCLTSPTGKCARVTIGGSGTGGTIGRHTKGAIRLIPGNTYTWSIWLRAIASKSIEVGHEQNGVKTVSVDNTWQKVTHTFVANDNQYEAFVVRMKNASPGLWFEFHSAMVEDGEKATGWSESPMDIIRASESLTERVKLAESKITEDAITNTVKKSFYTKSETENQIINKGYATTSQVQQKIDSLQIKFGESGGYNKLLNASFDTRDFSNWRVTSSKAVVNVHAASGRTRAVMTCVNGNNGGVNQQINLVQGYWYTVSANIVLESGVVAGLEVSYNGKYKGTRTNTSDFKGGILSYTFQAEESVDNANVLFYVDGKTYGSTGNGKNAYFYYTQFEEGQIATAFSPNPNEIYTTNAIFDKNGLRINQTNVGTYTEMRANGFFVKKNDGSLLFEASNKVVLYNGAGLSCVSILNDPSAAYGNARIDIRGGINFIHNPGQSTGAYNGIQLGNHDVSNQYGMHNLFLRCWNSLGFSDYQNNTHMFADVRRGRWIMKGALYQNTATPPSTFSMNFEGEDEVYNSGYSRKLVVESVLNLKTGVYVDNDGECCSAIYGGFSELVTTEYRDEYGDVTTHLNQDALNASLVVICQEQQELIIELRKELDEIKGHLNVA